MDYFGINSSEDLPKIKEVFAEQMVQPTLINMEDFKSTEADEIVDLPVSEPGDAAEENQEL
jgi:segregation and condensation protein B